MNKKKHPTIVDNYFLFWRDWPSQWHPSTFTIGGVTYSHAEQFMMAEKAKLFGDEVIRKKILDSNSPHTQKKLGRIVGNFDEDKWNSVAKEIVFLGNIAKFSQNEGFMNELLATKDLILVEASPYDKVWGIGLSQDDPDATRPEKWKGTNWLGEVLMRVRDVLTYKHRV